MSEALFIIDPQNDFMDSPDFQGALAVKGAYQDMQRLANYIKNKEIDAIYVTLDTHSKMDIAHPMWWVDAKGENPPAFTVITSEDVLNGKWKAAQSDLQDYSLFYVTQLKENNKYQLCVWPYHCIKGTQGHEVEKNLKDTLQQWEDNTGKKVNYIYKGQNPKTEHYSGLKAEVVLEDKDTHLNTDVIKALDNYDIIKIAGEASSHCVGSTGIDLLENLPYNSRSKVHYLINCMSAVTGFETNANDLIQKAQNMGARLDTVLESVKKLKM